MARFCRDVLGGRIVYSDEDFAVVELLGSVFMVHADHTYLDHPMTGIVEGTPVRGMGMEIRLYGCDPDAIEERARSAEITVLAGSIDKPHGIRECFIVGPAGTSSFPARRPAERALGWRLPTNAIKIQQIPPETASRL